MNRHALVVSNNCFSKSSNNGKTLESIFSGFPKDNISQLYFTDKFSPDFDFCKDYYRILDADVFYGIFVKRIKVGGVMDQQLFKEGIQSNSIITSRFLTAGPFQSFLRICRDILWKSESWKSSGIKEWCGRNKPDFVFFVGGGAEFAHNVAIFLADFLNIPLVSFFTDDYLIYPRKNNIFDLIQRYRMIFFYKKTIEKSSLCFAIGDLMCETYTSYFGKAFYPIMNSVNIEKYESKTDNSNELVINYFGSIHTNRWKMIIRLAEILNKLDNKPIVLNVYTENKLDNKILKLFQKYGVIYMGAIYGKKLRTTILESDILLHVESDDKNSVSKTILSISTKIPEYLISGRPILGFGPREIASMRYLTDNKIGIVISPSDKNTEINNQLEKLFTDKQLREDMGRFAYEFAVNNFDNRKIVKDFNMKIERILYARPGIGELMNKQIMNNI